MPVFYIKKNEKLIKDLVIPEYVSSFFCKVKPRFPREIQKIFMLTQKSAAAHVKGRVHVSGCV